MDVVDGLWRTSQGESGDEILQLLLGRLDLGGALRDGRGQSADRRFGFTKLIEGLLVQRGIMSDRGEIVSQPLFVLNELATLLFSLSSSAFCRASACRREATSPSAFFTGVSSSFVPTSTPRRS